MFNTTFFKSLLYLLIFMLVIGCSSNQTNNSNEEIQVFTAASFAPVLEEVNSQFNSENPNISFVMNKAGTQELITQIEQGAEADILIAAREKDIKRLEEQDLVESFEKIAGNELILIVSREGKEKVKSIQDLTKKNIRLVLAEEMAPVGQYSREMLTNLQNANVYGGDFYEKVMSNVVSNESNEQNVVSKILLGEADAGIVYKSSISSIKKKKKEEITSIEIDSLYNIFSYYYMVKIKNSTPFSDKYIEWIKSNKGQILLKKFGFNSL